jgi:hypothetical protein
MKTALEVLHKYFHHFNRERTRDLVVKAMEDYAKIYHDNEVKKLNIPAVIGNKPKSKSKKTLITPESYSKMCDIIKNI